jgi:ribosome-binding factor A
MSRRIEKINEVLKRELGQIILENVDFGRNVLITISRVDTAPDLSGAKIYVSVLPESFSKGIMEILQKKNHIIQKEINRIMEIRKIPKLIFYEDISFKKAAHIDELLKEIQDKAR